MALETLNGLSRIGEFSIANGDLGIWGDGSDDEGFSPITIDSTQNAIAFKIQDGPIKENGVNGCQVDTLIEVAKLMLLGLDKNFPCNENKIAIGRLSATLDALDKRTQDREKRGVEGTNKE